MDKTDLPELQPCPFCGGHAAKVHHYYANRKGDDGEFKHVVRFHGMCTECGASGPTHDTLHHQHAEARAVKAWNSSAIATERARADALAKENDTLRGMLGNSAKPCTYCGLAADDQGKCQYGFPGCMRADDQMLSKHFADGYFAEQEKKRADALEAALCEIREEWAGAECGEPVYAQEAYAIGLAKRMYQIAARALLEKTNDR